MPVRGHSGVQRFQVRETPDKASERVGRLVGYCGVVWIEGDGWETRPGWMGPLKVWKARRYARRNGIRLVEALRHAG